MRRKVALLLALLALLALAGLPGGAGASSAAGEEHEEDEDEEEEEEEDEVQLVGELKPRTPDYNLWDGIKEGAFSSHRFYGFMGEAYDEAQCNVYACPEGQRRRKNPTYAVPPAQGCSLFRIPHNEEWVVYSRQYELTGCCDRHARCYATCGASRKQCDQRYGECMLRQCRDRRDKYHADECEKLGRLLLTTAVHSGCDLFRDRQDESCLCESREEL